MKIVIIGGKGAQKISEVIGKTTDEKVTTYPNVIQFLNEAAMRSLTIHRVILMQDGIDEVDDQKVYDFVDFLTNYYPSVRIVTISKNPEIAKYFGDLITSIYATHFMLETIRSKMVIELAVGRIEELNKKYSNIIYKKKNETFTNIIEEETKENQDKSKNSFLRKLFGMGPKNKKTKNNTQNISVKHQPNSENYDYEKEDVNEDVEEMMDSEEVEFDMLDDFENDIGLGMENDDKETSTEIFGDEDFDEDFDDEDFENDEDFEEEFGDEEFEENFDDEEEFEEEFEESFDDEEDFEDDHEKENEEEYQKTETKENTQEMPSYSEELKKRKEQMIADFDNLIGEKTENPTVTKNKSNIKTEVTLEEIDDEDLGLSGEQLERLLRENEKRNTKVVEKLITVTKGGKNSYRNKNGVRLIIVTGDRRIGTTKLSLNLAHMYSKNEKTLLVDFDRYRKGMLGYVGIDYVIDFIDFKQNGVKFLSTGKKLESLTYPFPNSSFDVLGSMYGEEINDNQIKVAQKTLYNQNIYDTVVVDCPLENLYLLEDLIYAANILYCIEDTKIGVTNSILSLNSSVDDKMLTPLYNNVNFVVGRTANIGKFRENLDSISELFGLEETTTNWSKVKIIGTLTQDGIKELAMVMED